MSEESPALIKSRKWVLTLWPHNAYDCLELTMKNLTDTGRVRFIAYGSEVCPTDGTLHYQAFLVGYGKVSNIQLSQWFGEKHYFKPMYGSLKQNEAYCSKEGHYTKLGDEPKQGERHDLIGFKREIDTGKRPVEVAEDENHFGPFVKYHAGMDKYFHAQQFKKHKTDFTAPVVYIRLGTAGVGKTKFAYEYDPNLYDMPDLTGKWFGSYCGQPTVLFDDVEAGQIPPLAMFKKLLDRYPIEVPVKGGFTCWKPRTIFVTSNQDLHTWWKDMTPIDVAAIHRRVYKIVKVWPDHDEIVYTNDAFQSQAQGLLRQKRHGCCQEEEDPDDLQDATWESDSRSWPVCQESQEHHSQDF